MAMVALVDAWTVPAAREFFMNVWPMYVHDLSAYDTDFYALDASGRWQPDIAGDWANPDQALQRAHVIMADGVPVGFACIGLRPFEYMPPEADVSLAEFFLVHRSRGRGIGRHALEMLLERYPGRWSLSAVHDNARAIRFWRKTLPLLGPSDLREGTEGGDVVWKFVVARQSR